MFNIFNGTKVLSMFFNEFQHYLLMQKHIKCIKERKTFLCLKIVPLHAHFIKGKFIFKI